MNEDLELQQYLFDLQGYVVIENALDEDELNALNALLDEREIPEPGKGARFGSSPAVRGTPSGFLQWGKPFCDLLDHPAIMPILRLRLGACFRLDRLYGMRRTTAASAAYPAATRAAIRRRGESRTTPRTRPRSSSHPRRPVRSSSSPRR